MSTLQILSARARVMAALVLALVARCVVAQRGAACGIVVSPTFVHQGECLSHAECRDADRIHSDDLPQCFNAGLTCCASKLVCDYNSDFQVTYGEGMCREMSRCLDDFGSTETAPDRPFVRFRCPGPSNVVCCKAKCQTAWSSWSSCEACEGTQLNEHRQRTVIDTQGVKVEQDPQCKEAFGSRPCSAPCTTTAGSAPTTQPTEAPTPAPTTTTTAEILTLPPGSITYTEPPTPVPVTVRSTITSENDATTSNTLQATMSTSTLEGNAAPQQLSPTTTGTASELEWWIFAAIGGGVCFCCVLVLLAVWWRKRNRKGSTRFHDETVLGDMRADSPGLGAYSNPNIDSGAPTYDRVEPLPEVNYDASFPATTIAQTQDTAPLPAVTYDAKFPTGSLEEEATKAREQDNKREFRYSILRPESDQPNF